MRRLRREKETCIQFLMRNETGNPFGDFLVVSLLRGVDNFFCLMNSRSYVPGKIANLMWDVVFQASFLFLLPFFKFLFIIIILPPDQNDCPI